MIDEQTLSEVRRIIGDRAGHRFTKATEQRLQAAVETRVRIRNVPAERYPVVLLDEPAERDQFMELLVVPETSFFRDNAQFKSLAEEIVPRINGTVVAWSAGCSTGQEPYSLAMTFAELGVPDWWVVASDLSQHAVDRTSAGFFRERELRGLSPARRMKWMDQVRDGWQVKPELRARVRTVRHNLATETPPVRQHEVSVIFSRNVLIYLKPEAIAAYLKRVADWLAPGGYLFLGMSEVLWEVDDRFERVRLEGGAFAYRRVDDRNRRRLDPARRTPVPESVENLNPRTKPRTTLPGTRTSLKPVRDLSRAIPTADGTASQHRKAGEDAAAAGRNEEAVAAFRKAIYLDPDDALAHLELGLALEATGDVEAGRRAFRAARSAVERADRRTLEAALEGYDIDTVRSLLQAKLGVD